MRKKSLMALMAIFASTSVIAADTTVPYKGTVASSTMYSGHGDESAVVKLVFQCVNTNFGPADLCIDADIVVHSERIGTSMVAQIEPILSVHTRTVVMRYTYRTSPAVDAPENYLIGVLYPDRKGTVFKLSAGQEMFVTCVSYDGGSSWQGCGTTISS